MAADPSPTIAPAAAARWQHAAPASSPWLHEEVGRRMEERLEWIKRTPAAWADWEPVRGGLAAHAAVARRYPRAQGYVVETEPARIAAAKAALARPWWRRVGAGPAPQLGAPPAGAMEMVWANMLLHMQSDPQVLIRQWQQALAVEGFLMFSCLGPDTLRELRALYAALGWPPPAHEFTDMHDWGDMLVASGFAEPVVDMERLTLNFATPARLLQELRALGANLHVQRFAALRGRDWRRRLEEAIDQQLRGADGQLALTFEIVYGHALKPRPRPRVSIRASVPLDDMRTMLQSGKSGGE